MTVRFQTWVEANTLPEAWEKLRLSLEDKRMGDKLKSEFTATILEDGAEDKANIKGELTVREVKEFCKDVMEGDCSVCPLYDWQCWREIGPCSWSIEEVTETIRGYKPEGEER